MSKTLQKNELNDVTEDKNISDKRRELLTTAGKLSAVMLALGVTGKNILGQPIETLTEREKAVQELFQYAIRTGDMKTAIKIYGEKAQVEEKHIKALMSLTAEDLKFLKEIQEKLAVAGGSIAQVW